MSGSPWPSATAAWSPAVSVPRSAATSVASSRLTSPGARIHSARASASDSNASAPSATNSWSIATVVEPSRWVTTSAKPARRRIAGKPASSLRNAVISRSGLRPGWSRRYALSRSVSPSTTDVCDWSAPRSRSGPGPSGARSRRAPGRAGHQGGRRTRPGSSSRASAAMVRPSAIATASARHVPSPGAATRRGRPVRARLYRSRAPSSSRTTIVASTCGPASSRTNASSSDASPMVRPLAPNQRAAGDRVEVERRDRRGDLGSGGTADVSRPC